MTTEQVCLSDMQKAKHWGTEVCSSEKVHSQSSQERKPENRSVDPEGEVLGLFMGEKYTMVRGSGKVNGGRRKVR